MPLLSNQHSFINAQEAFSLVHFQKGVLLPLIEIPFQITTSLGEWGKTLSHDNTLTAGEVVDTHIEQHIPTTKPDVMARVASIGLDVFGTNRPPLLSDRKTSPSPIVATETGEGVRPPVSVGQGLPPMLSRVVGRLNFV